MKKEKLLYVVKWSGEIIGEIFTNDENMYMYVPNIDKINELEKVGLPAEFVREGMTKYKKRIDPMFIRHRLKVPTVNRMLITDAFTIEDVEEEA